MTAFSTALLVLRHDLRVEWRSPQTLISTLSLAALATLVAATTFYVDRLSAPKAAPGVIWITTVFCAMLGLQRSWAREQQNQAFGLFLFSPCSRSGIYFGKVISTTLWLGAVATGIAGFVWVLFQLQASAITLVHAVLIIWLGVLGIAATGTLFAAVSVKTQLKELALSLALLPLLAPAALAGAVGTREILLAQSAWGWFQILLVFDLMALAVGNWLFELMLVD